LRQLRLALGFETQSAMAAHLGMEAPRWNNLERGYPLGMSAALLIVRKVPGLTIDWLVIGREAGLSVDLHQRLSAAAAENGEGPTGAT
jgi:hypothetical protein